MVEQYTTTSHIDGGQEFIPVIISRYTCQKCGEGFKSKTLFLDHDCEKALSLTIKRAMRNL